MEDKEDNYGKYDILPYRIWRLAESVSVVEAALLILDIEPQGVAADVESQHDDEKPKGYIAARRAVASALKARILEGQWEFEVQSVGSNGQLIWDEDSIDVKKSTVELDSLRKWLFGKFYECKTFPYPTLESETPYLNDSHTRYSPKLAAVVEAWEAYDENDMSSGTPKQKLEKWLRLNAPRFGFTDENGATQENVIKDLAKVANWATKGGAPKQADAESEADNTPF